jgi:peptidoglycan/LPS O-acetylase OafA/YrhL
MPGTHLWTMPVEIRFYFLIPFISLVFSRIYKYYLIVWPLQILNVIFLIQIRRKGLFSISDGESFLRVYLPIFFIGSTTAMAFINIEENKLLKKLDSFRIYQLLSSVPCFAIFFTLARIEGWYNIERDDSYICTSAMSILLLIILVAPSNFFNYVMTNTIVFKIFGKYSYGTYLFHGYVIYYIKKNEKIRRYTNNLTDLVLITVCLSLLYGFIFFHAVENNLMYLSKYVIKLLDRKIKIEYILIKKENDSKNEA